MPKVLEIVMKAVDKASSVLRGVGKEAKRAGEEAEKGFSFRQAGREWKKSETAAFLKTIRGAGMLGGVTLIGHEFSAVTDKVMELNEAYARGDETRASYFNKMAQSLPVIGSFVSAFNKIINAKQQAEIDRTNREADFSDVATGASKAMLTAYKNIREQIAKEEITLNVRTKLAGLRGLERDVVKASADAQQQVAEARDKKASRLKQFDEAAGENIQKARALVSKATSEDEKGLYRARLSSLQKQQADERLKIEQESDKEINETAAAADAERYQATRDAMQESFKITQAYNAAVWDTQAQTIQIRLRGNRDFLAAELAQYRQSTIDKKRELDQQYQDAAKKALPGDRGALYSAFIAQRNALDDQEQANATASIRNTLDESNLKVLQMAADAGDAQAKAQLEQLQALREEADLRKQLATVIKDTAADPAAKAQAQQQLRRLDQADKQRAAKTLRDQYDQTLELQEKYGATEAERNDAKRKLEREKIIKEAKERKARLDAFLKDPGATDAQRAQARQQFEDWQKLQGRRFDEEVGGGGRISKPDATFENSLFLTGRAQKAAQAEDKQNRLIELSQNAVNAMNEVRDAVRDLNTTSEKAPRVQIGTDSAGG